MYIPQESFSAPSRGGMPAAASAAPWVKDAFLAHVNAAIDAHRSHNTQGALLLVHINNLAMIINAYGHEVSEDVMHAIGGLLKNTLLPEDHVERVERDQFAVLLTHSAPADSEQMARKLVDVIQNYGRDHFAAASLHVVATIGAVHFPTEAENAVEALDRAYVALHSFRAQPYRTWPESQHEGDLCRQQMGLANYLYSAYREQRLRLAWQPVIETQTGRVSHYEALLRLLNLTGKMTSAGALIPIAEQMGLIEDIDIMVLEMVVRELQASPGVSLALNVSNVSSEGRRWLARAEQLLADHDVASRLVVEITETAAQRDLRQAAYFVAAVQGMGCHVALDDFGSGYTSFRQLKSLSVDYVKIDGAFIKDLETNADNRFFVKTLMDFARGFGVKTVAEFVESGEAAKILMELGVDYMQGYYFARPESRRRWLNEGEYKADELTGR